MIKLKLYQHISILFLILNSIKACPTEIQQFCSCVDESDGVLLNCLNNDNILEVLHTLKTVQSQIGLIKFLAIKNSNIFNLSSNIFTGLYIKRLEISNCKIKSLENKAFSGLEPTLQELNLANNLIEKIPVSSLTGLNVVKLNLSNNLITEIKQEDALPAMQKLSDIDFSYNKISNIHKSFFDNVKNSIKTINLGHNIIIEIPASSLRGLKQLMALHLHNNQIRNISALSFMNLSKLSLLNIASNKIKNIHKQAFLNTPNLRYLYITDNQLREIEPYQFSAFEQLEMIDLSNNKIEKINSYSFSNLISLKQLYLGENQIAQIKNNAFENTSITILILESNELKNIDKDIFKDVKKIQQLSLKENKIKNIDANAFQNNPELVMLDLSKNNIIDLSPATFISQLKIILVDLSNNKLLRTPYSAFNKRVNTVLLQENPLVCIEKIHILQQGVGIFIPNNKNLICENQEEEINSSIKKENSSNHNLTSVNITEEVAFKQLSVNEPLINQITESSLVHKLPNIKPIQIKNLTNDNLKTVKEEQDNTKIFTKGVTRFNHFLKKDTTSTTKLPEYLKIKNLEFIDDNMSVKNTINKDFLDTTNITNIDDNHAIYPFSVPFLTRPPKFHTAQRIVQNNEQNFIVTQTLPPSIVIASHHKTNKINSLSETDLPIKNVSNQYSSITNELAIEEFKLQNDDSKTNLLDSNETNKASILNLNESKQKKQNMPTAIIIICLSTVVLVMCAVFVGMCAAKRRQVQLIGCISEPSVINSNIVNLPTYNMKKINKNLTNIHDIYENETFNRNNGQSNRLSPLQDDIYGWLYSNTIYNNYSNKK